MRRFLGWVERQAGLFIVVGMLINGALLVRSIEQGHTASRLTSRLRTDEHASCIIEARGLPAAHHLAAVMEAINKLVQPVEQNPLARGLPHAPPVPAYYAPWLYQLRHELPEYLRLTEAQPAGRDC